MSENVLKKNENAAVNKAAPSEGETSLQKALAGKAEDKPERPENKDDSSKHPLHENVRAERAEQLRQKAGAYQFGSLGSIRISAAKSYNAVVDQALRAEESVQQQAQEDTEDEPSLMFNALQAPMNLRAQNPVMRSLHFAVVGFTVFWLVFSTLYVLGSGQLYGLTPVDLGAIFAGMFAPPALFWMIVSAIHRRADVDQYAYALRSELQSLLFPSEETSRLINKDIERLCRQAAEVSAASKAVLKSLHRARQGLRTEIRDFSGVSKKAEFHIDRLAESLKEKSTQLLTLTEEIEKRTQSIDGKAHAGVEAWDQATKTILQRAGEMEGALGQGADKILKAADDVSTKTKSIEGNLKQSYENLNSAVDEAAKRLEGLSTKFEGHSDKLSNVTTHISAETQRLATMISSQVDNLEDVTDRTVESMARSAETIQQHKEALDRGAESVAVQSERIAESIKNSVAKLDETVENASGKADDLSDRIEVKTAALRDVVKGIAKEADIIDEIGQHAANRLGEALGVAVSGAESISQAVRRAVESLETSTKSARDQAEALMQSAREHVAQLGEAGEGNAAHIRSILTLLEKSREQIQIASQSSKQHIDELSSALENQEQKISMSVLNLSERMTEVKESLSIPLKDLQAAVQEADGRHEMIESVLRRRVSDLNEASQKATESAEKIRDILKGQAQEISTLSGQISSHARRINEQMVHQSESLSSHVTGSLEKISEVTTVLDTQVSRLSGVSQTISTDITQLRDDISGRCDEISSFTTRAFADLINIDESLDSKITLIKDRAETAAQSVLQVKEALETTAQDIDPVCMRAIEQAEKAHERFEALKVGFETTAHSNLSKLQQVGIFFDDRLQSLKDGAGEAATLLRSSSDHLHDRVKDIESASKSAGDKMRDIAATLEDQSSDIHLLTDQSLLKVEFIQKAINEQFHEFSASVGQAVAQLQDAGREFVKHSELLRQESDQVTQGFDRAGSKALDQSRVLTDAVDQTKQRAELTAAAMKQEVDNLVEKANESLFELKKAGDAFSIRAREVGEQMRVSLQTSESYSRHLKTQAASIGDVSTATAEQLGKAVSVLTGKMSDVSKAANDVTLRVEDSRDKLATEAERLLHVSSAALEAAQDAATTFSRQSESLFKASQDASSFIKRIRETEVQAQRDAFLSSAKFIVESLYSLSVDVTRLMEGEVSEKTWKAFQKGDVTAFTRKLLELSDNGQWPVEKARDKFARDTEFRNYVQRYIRQFEEMYDRAVENDHGALLSATIGSSEVAKLYQMLCTISGKEPKITRETAKAA